MQIFRKFAGEIRNLREYMGSNYDRAKLAKKAVEQREVIRRKTFCRSAVVQMPRVKNSDNIADEQIRVD